MPDFPLEVRNETGCEPYVVTLAKVPKYVRGVWFDLGGGAAARLEAIRKIGGDVVLFGVREAAGVPENARSVSAARRR